MKKFISIILLSTFFLLIFTVGADAEDKLSAHLELKALSENELSDAELIVISGQGMKAPFPEEVEEGNSRIKLWDEAKNGIINTSISTGYRNYQKNVLSIQGR